MPKLISFDVGIRNLAYCIFMMDISGSGSGSTVSIQDWNVIDISREKEKENDSVELKKCSQSKSKKEMNVVCLKTAKYCMGSHTFCEKHAKTSGFILPCKEFEKTQIKKLSVDSLNEFIIKWKIDLSRDLGEKKNLHKGDKIDIIFKWIEEHVLQKIGNSVSKKKKETLDFIQIGRNMVDHLSNIDLADIDYVIIENQISPIANKMRTIQGMLAQIFILQNVPTIEFVSSSNKLREYLGESKKEKEKEKDVPAVNPDYKQHKKDGIRYTKEWLESRFITWKPFFDSFPKKQDDLADAFLQGIWYLRKRMGKIIEK